REPGQAREHLARVGSTGRIIRIDHDQGACAARDERLDLRRIGHKVVLGLARVVHSAPAVQIDSRCPERIVRARYQYLIAIIEQRAQHHVDELTDAVTDEYLFRADARDTSALLLHDHGFPGRKDPLLVAVALAVR